jgi:hypothetical protein
MIIPIDSRAASISAANNANNRIIFLQSFPVTLAQSPCETNLFSASDFGLILTFLKYLNKNLYGEL